MSILGDLFGGGSGFDIQEAVSQENPYAALFSQLPSLPSSALDFMVNDRGQIVDTAGNIGRFIEGTWVPSSGINFGQAAGSLSGLRDLLRGVGSAATSRGGMAGIAALLSMMDRQKARGGGAGTAYAGAKPMTRTMTQGRYGPIARYAASGGLMQAYAQGGSVQPFPMQDGGFVMTKRAVDGAGGPQGMRQEIPEAVPIRGPGHGTSDSIPAYIQGENGRTPAKVSNGEMYIPPGRNTQGLYALMRALERKA